MRAALIGGRGGGAPAPGAAAARGYATELCTHRRHARRWQRPRVCAAGGLMACAALLLLCAQPTARVERGGGGSAAARLRSTLAELHRLAARGTAGRGEKPVMPALREESAEEKMLDAVMQQARAEVAAEHAKAERQLEKAEARDLSPVQAHAPHGGEHAAASGAQGPRASRAAVQGQTRAEKTLAAALARDLGAVADPNLKPTDSASAHARATPPVSVLQAANTKTANRSAVQEPAAANVGYAQNGTRNASASAMHTLSQQALQRSAGSAHEPAKTVTYRSRPLATFLPSGHSDVHHALPAAGHPLQPPSPVVRPMREENAQVMLQLGTMLWIAVSVFAVMASAKTIRGYFSQREQVRLLQEVADLQRKRDLGMISDKEFQRALEPLLRTLNSRRVKATTPQNVLSRKPTVSEVDRLRASYARRLSGAHLGLVLFDSDGDEGFVVRTVKPSSAAALSRKIHAGDRLLAIAGTRVEDLSDHERDALATQILREPTLCILRRTDGTERQVMLECTAPVETPRDQDSVTGQDDCQRCPSEDVIVQVQPASCPQVTTIDAIPQGSGAPAAANADLERVSKEVEAVGQRLDQGLTRVSGEVAKVADQVSCNQKTLDAVTSGLDDAKADIAHIRREQDSVQTRVSREVEAVAQQLDEGLKRVSEATSVHRKSVETALQATLSPQAETVEVASQAAFDAASAPLTPSAAEDFIHVEASSQASCAKLPLDCSTTGTQTLEEEKLPHRTNARDEVKSDSPFLDLRVPSFNWGWKTKYTAAVPSHANARTQETCNQSEVAGSEAQAPVLQPDFNGETSDTTIFSSARDQPAEDEPLPQSALPAESYFKLLAAHVPAYREKRSYSYGSISHGTERRRRDLAGTQDGEEASASDELGSNAWPHLPVPGVERSARWQSRSMSFFQKPAFLREDGAMASALKRAKRRCQKDLQQPAVRAVLALILLVSSMGVAAVLAPVALLKAFAVLISGVSSAVMVSLFSTYMLSVSVESSNADSIVISSCQSSTSSATSDEDDHYVDWLISVTAGCGAGQTRRISAYEARTKTLFISRPWECDPDMTSSCVLYVDPWLNPMSIFEHIFSQHEPLEAPALTRQDSKRVSSKSVDPVAAAKPPPPEERIKDYLEITEGHSGSATSYERRRQEHRAVWADRNLAPPNGPPDSLHPAAPDVFLTARDTASDTEEDAPRTQRGPAPSGDTYQGRSESSYQEALAFLEAATSAYQQDSGAAHGAPSTDAGDSRHRSA